MVNRMVDVLAEFARTLATDFPIQAILDHLVVRIVDVLPIEGAGVTLAAGDDRPVFVAASDEAAMRYERIQAEVGSGPCSLAYGSGTAVTVPDLRLDDRFPGFAERAVAMGLVAVFTFPLHHGDEPLGALDLYRSSPGPLDPEAMEAAQTLADVAAAYLINARARADLLRSVEQVRTGAVLEAVTAQALRASELRNSAILASALDAVVTVDGQGHIVESNPAAERSFGLAQAEAVGRELGDLVDPPEGLVAGWAGLGAFVAAADDGSTTGRRADLTARRADGTPFPTEVSVSAVQGVLPELFTVFVRDVTERVTADARRAQLEDRLRQVERLESLGLLAGGVAHDFNNLLMVILSYASFIAEDASDGEVSGHAREIVSAAQRAARLTHQLLMFARREPTVRRVVDLNESVSVVGELLARAVGENVRLVVTLPDEQLPIRADRGQIEQVLVNLAVNARDAMEDGGTLAVATALVVLDGTELAQLTMTDTGIGMRPGVLARALEPFFTTKGPGEGTGLGLATVYGIVTDAGGTIDLTSAPGAGTTVVVRFPIDRSSSSANADDEVEPGPDLELAPTATVLVVEDQAAVRTVTAAMLRRAGYSVLEAPDAKTAMALAAGSAFDIVLSDVVMPEVSGRELVGTLRSLGLAPRVLFMSGYSGGALAGGTTLSADEVLLRKPFTEQELLTAIATALAEPCLAPMAPSGPG